MDELQKLNHNGRLSKAVACSSTIVHCILETAVLVTKNEVSHLSSVASLLAMFQIRGSSITVDGSVTLAQVTVTNAFVNTGTDYVGPFEIKKWQYWMEDYNQLLCSIVYPHGN